MDEVKFERARFRDEFKSVKSDDTSETTADENKVIDLSATEETTIPILPEYDDFVMKAPKTTRKA